MHLNLNDNGAESRTCAGRDVAPLTHNKENRENICNIVRVFMFQQRLEKHYRLRDSKLAERGSASGPLEN